MLTPDFFQQEYVNAGKRLDQLHAETGFHRKLLAEYAKSAGIQLATARQPYLIDPDWLAEQYLAKRRSFPAIAAELGFSAMTVAKAAHAAGITARTPGITSHPDLLTQLGDDYPSDLRAAVNGQPHGWQRLRRFRQVMQHRSSQARGPTRRTRTAEYPERSDRSPGGPRESDQDRGAS